MVTLEPLFPTYALVFPVDRCRLRITHIGPSTIAVGVCGTGCIDSRRREPRGIDRNAFAMSWSGGTGRPCRLLHPE
jgi:hypothetical protein